MKNILQTLKFAGLVGIASLSGCDAVRNSAESLNNYIDNRTFENLEQYAGEKREYVNPKQEIIWDLATEDIRTYPELKEMINKRKIDTHSLCDFYIKKGRPLEWNFPEKNEK